MTHSWSLGVGEVRRILGLTKERNGGFIYRKELGMDCGMEIKFYESLLNVKWNEFNDC